MSITAYTCSKYEVEHKGLSGWECFSELCTVDCSQRS